MDRYLIRHHLAPIWTFALFGPAIGILTALLLSAPTSMNHVDGRFALVFIMFGYIYGIVPAALAGLLYTVGWHLRSPFPRLNAAQFGCLLGLMSGLLAFQLYAMLVGIKGLPNDLRIYLLPSAAGAICGILAAHARERLHDWVECAECDEVDATDHEPVRQSRDDISP